MENPAVWLVKLLLAHLITDFILQPVHWIENRNEKHFRSGYLYLHGLVTAAVAYLFIGGPYWMVALIILVSHILIDAGKSYMGPGISVFLIDQLLHVLVILLCFCFTFSEFPDIATAWSKLSGDIQFWKLIIAVVFLTMPAGILVGQLTRQWSNKLEKDEEGRKSLANAGKWIGVAERIIVLVFVLYNQYEAIGLLIAAKGIIRFNEKDRPEIKTEYLVIGTLLSIGIAIVTGVAIRL